MEILDLAKRANLFTLEDLMFFKNYFSIKTNDQLIIKLKEHIKELESIE